MPVIRLENLRKGMKPSDDVLNHRGSILIPRGREIQDKHLRILKMWGITEVIIQETDVDPIEMNTTLEISPEIYQKAMNRVKYLFQHTDYKHPAIRELIDQCVRRNIIDMVKEKTNA